MILIPLPKKSSRGDQIENARIFQRQGFAEMILEENLTPDCLLDSINTVFSNREKYISQMKTLNSDLALHKLFNLINTISAK